MKIQLVHKFEDIVSIENLLEAWREFLRGKRGKRDVQEFQLRLMENILSLHADLMNGAYTHGSYEAFNINDPKPRSIHKATVRDRLVHHAIHRVLRAATKRRMVKRLRENSRKLESIISYRGLLRYGNTHKIHREVLGLSEYN